MLRKMTFDEFSSLLDGEKVFVRSVFAEGGSGHPAYHGVVNSRHSFLGHVTVYIDTDAPGWHEHCGLQMSNGWTECRSFHCSNYYTLVKVV